MTFHPTALLTGRIDTCATLFFLPSVNTVPVFDSQTLLEVGKKYLKAASTNIRPRIFYKISEYIFKRAILKSSIRRRIEILAHWERTNSYSGGHSTTPLESTAWYHYALLTDIVKKDLRGNCDYSGITTHSYVTDNARTDAKSVRITRNCA